MEMVVDRMNFSDMKPEEVTALRLQSHKSRRSPEHQWAWEHKEQLIKEARQTSIGKVADKYKVDNRTIRRWVTGR